MPSHLASHHVHPDPSALFSTCCRHSASRLRPSSTALRHLALRVCSFHQTLTAWDRSLPSLLSPPLQLALPSQGEVDPWRRNSLKRFLRNFFLQQCLSKERSLSRLDVRNSFSILLLLPTSPPLIFVVVVVIAMMDALRLIASR